MKKLILIPFLFFALMANSQILQNVSSQLNTKVSVCADTTEHEDYSCQISQEIDSTSLGVAYTDFLKMCDVLTGHKTTSFVCQLTEKQSFTPDKRIIIRWNNEQMIVNYGDLSTANKTKFNTFIVKVSSEIK